jgi:hypothetical protein
MSSEHCNELELILTCTIVLFQDYYAWTTRNPICKFIHETKSTGIMRFNIIFQPQCITLGVDGVPNQKDVANEFWLSASATSSQSPASQKPLSFGDILNTRRSLFPLHLHAKTLTGGRYWPNGGRSYPEPHYRDPPPFTIQLHVLHDAVVMSNGDVIGAGRRRRQGEGHGHKTTPSEQFENVKLARYFCLQEVGFHGAYIYTYIYIYIYIYIYTHTHTYTCIADYALESQSFQTARGFWLVDFSFIFPHLEFLIESKPVMKQ